MIDSTILNMYTCVRQWSHRNTDRLRKCQKRKGKKSMRESLTVKWGVLQEPLWWLLLTFQLSDRLKSHMSLRCLFRQHHTLSPTDAHHLGSYKRYKQNLQFFIDKYSLIHQQFWSSVHSLANLSGAVINSFKQRHIFGLASVLLRYSWFSAPPPPPDHQPLCSLISVHSHRTCSISCH